MNPDTLRALFKQDRYDEVISLASADPDLLTANPSLALPVAASQLALGNPNAAYQSLLQVEAAMPLNAAYLSLRGVACRRLGKHQEALRRLEEAISLSPDAKEYRNNYANLLIDLHRYQEAHEILCALVASFPHYQDAVSNLQLVKTHLAQTEEHSSPSQQSQPPSSGDAHTIAVDPLSLAFSDEEVAANREKYKALGRLTSLQVRRLAARIPTPPSKKVADDLVRLSGHLLAEQSFEAALATCSKAHSLSDTPQANIYIAASDIYIRLQRFLDAEVCILHAHLLSSPTHNTTVNLFSLALMRQDLKLAAYCLSLLSEINPNSEALPSLQKQLQDAKLRGTCEPFSLSPSSNSISTGKNSGQ